MDENFGQDLSADQASTAVIATMTARIETGTTQPGNWAHGNSNASTSGNESLELVQQEVVVVSIQL